MAIRWGQEQESRADRSTDQKGNRSRVARPLEDSLGHEEKRWKAAPWMKKAFLVTPGPEVRQGVLHLAGDSVCHRLAPWANQT